MADAILNRRVIIGWRSESIGKTLDRCAEQIGYLDVDRTAEKLPDTLGRLSRVHETQKDAEKFFRNKYKDKIAQADARRYQVLKDNHAEYVVLYKKFHAQSSPASVNQFLKSGAHKLWTLGKFIEAVHLTAGVGDAMRKRQDEGFQKIRELNGLKRSK